MKDQLIEQICNIVFGAMSTEEKLTILKEPILKLLNKKPTNISIQILDHNGFKIRAAKIIHDVLDINLRESRDIVDKIPTSIDEISITKAKMLQERFTEFGIKSKILQ